MNSTSIKTGLRIPRLKLRQREAILFYLCISPWLIGFFLFYLGPILASFYYSLTEWDLLTSPQFIGLDNYVRLFTRDPLALKSFKVTLVYTLVYVPLDLVFGLLLALL
jgi:multiple sugar transport system permease protein